MSELLGNFSLSDYLTSDRMLGFGRAVLILVVGLLVARVASRAAARGLRRHVSAQEAMLVRRLSYYVLLALVVTSALQQLGFQLGVLLGAAGVLTVQNRTARSYSDEEVEALQTTAMVLAELISSGDLTAGSPLDDAHREAMRHLSGIGLSGGIALGPHADQQGGRGEAQEQSSTVHGFSDLV